MQQLTPEKHSLHAFIILTLFVVVGLVSTDTFSPFSSFGGQWRAGFFMLGLSLFMLVLGFIAERSARGSRLFARYAVTLTDFRYMRFAIASGAAFSGAFVFIGGGSFVFIHQLNLSPATYVTLFASAIGSYLLSATMGTTLIRNMSRSQSSMLAASLMLMGAVTCLGSSILTNGTSISGCLLGVDRERDTAALQAV